MLYTLIITVFMSYTLSKEPAAVQIAIPVETAELCEQAKTAYLAEPIPEIVIKNRENMIYASKSVICVQTATHSNNNNSNN